MGKYLLFTIILVAVSIFVSVITLNLYHRSGATHTMPEWVRWVFLKQLPSKLCIKPQEDSDFDEMEDTGLSKETSFCDQCMNVADIEGTSIPSMQLFGTIDESTRSSLCTARRLSTISATVNISHYQNPQVELREYVKQCKL